MKRVIAAIIIIIFSFSQFGCIKKQSKSTTANPSSKSSSESKGSDCTNVSDASKNEQEIKLVKKANKTKYLLTNGIEIKNMDRPIATSKGKISISTFSISGLSDKSLEIKINNSIANDTQNEILNYVNECSTIPESLMVSAQFNANNLLSVAITDFSSSPEDGIFVYGFLYRLTDGQRLYLKDIFTQGTDYISLINQKVVEGMLRKGMDEEQNLSEPFRTIDEDQDFIITNDLQLDMVFKPGECGFKVRNIISVPMSEIDDYVDVMDRYSSTQRKTQEKTAFLIRNNNIFTDRKGDIIKNANGNILCYYPEISGLRDDAFESIINSTISEGINELKDSEVLTGLTKDKDKNENYVATVNMEIDFNAYGILCISRRVSNSNQYNTLQQFNKVYSFDLNNKKIINTKDMVKKYIGSNKNLQKNFTNSMKKNIEVSYIYQGINLVNKINAVADYSYAIQNADIDFIEYGPPQCAVQILVHFQPGTIKGVSDAVDCIIPLSSISNGVPEDFFGW